MRVARPSEAGPSPWVESRLLLGQWLGGQHMQAHGLEAEAGIEIIGDAVETQLDQARDVRGVARRRGKPDVDVANFSVGAEQHEAQRARAHAVVHQVIAEAREQRLAASTMCSADEIGSTKLPRVS